MRRGDFEFSHNTGSDDFRDRPSAPCPTPPLSTSSSTLTDAQAQQRVAAYIQDRKAGPLHIATMQQALPAVPVAAIRKGLLQALNTAQVHRPLFQNAIRKCRRKIEDLQGGGPLLISPAQAEKAKVWQARLEMFEAMAGQYRRRPDYKRPLSLLEFLAVSGGLNLPKIGNQLGLFDAIGTDAPRNTFRASEVAAIFDGPVVVAPFGILAQKHGRLSVERAAEAATEAGYIMANATGNGVDVDAFVEAVERDFSALRQKRLQDRVFSRHDQGEAIAYLEGHNNEISLSHYIGQFGVPPKGEEKSKPWLEHLCRLSQTFARPDGRLGRDHYLYAAHKLGVYDSTLADEDDDVVTATVEEKLAWDDVSETTESMIAAFIIADTGRKLAQPVRPRPALRAPQACSLVADAPF